MLWLTRFLFLVVGAGILAHWKNFSFTQSDDDRLVSISGGKSGNNFGREKRVFFAGVNGIMNCVSRIIAGALLDRFRFSHVMPIIGSLLTIILISIYFIAQTSFLGLIICTWIIYALSFAQFSTVPAQVDQELVLFLQF